MTINGTMVQSCGSNNTCKTFSRNTFVLINNNLLLNKAQAVALCSVTPIFPDQCLLYLCLSRGFLPEILSLLNLYEKAVYRKMPFDFVI